MKPSINQVVGYVAPATKPGEAPAIKKGVVLEAYNDGTAKIDLTPRNADGTAVDPAKEPIGHHFAIATFNADKQTENSFHALEETAAPATKPQPASASTTAAASSSSK